MIPVSPDRVYEYKDKDNDILLKFRYLTGEHVNRYAKITSRIGKDNDSVVMTEYSKDLIDLFLVGWEGNDLPKFPKDKEPSKMFMLQDLIKLAEIISQLLEELTGVKIEELKN